MNLLTLKEAIRKADQSDDALLDFMLNNYPDILCEFAAGDKLSDIRAYISETIAEDLRTGCGIKWINAIREYRQLSGADLRDAKIMVEDLYLDQNVRVGRHSIGKGQM